MTIDGGAALATTPETHQNQGAPKLFTSRYEELQFRKKLFAHRKLIRLLTRHSNQIEAYSNNIS